MTLKGQIIGATLGLAIAVAAALALVVGDLVTDQIRERIGVSLSDLSTEMADRLSREMAVRIAEVNVLAGLPALGDVQDVTQTRSVIEHLQTSVPEFSWIGVLDTGGTVVAATDRVLEGVNISHRPVFIEGIKERFVGDVHDAVLLASLIENPTGEPMKFVDIAMPIYGPDGETAGVLATHLSWSWVRSVEQALLSGAASRRDVDLFVVSADGTVLLGPDLSLLGQSLAFPAITEAMAGRTGWAIETWADGEDYLTGFTEVRGHGRFEGFGWVVLARSPVAVAFQPITDLATRIAAIGLVFAALAAALGWVISSRIAGPVKALSRAAHALRQDQTAAFPKIRGPREIEVLSEAFADLVGSLIAKQTDLDAVTDQAFNDPLTDLGNRASLEKFIALRQHSEGAYAVLAIDLDGFKQVNDNHGHDAGDVVLQEVAGRLRGCMRAGDFLVRSGGDEFLAFLVMAESSIDSPIRRVAARIVDQISEPFQVSRSDGRKPLALRIGASVGIGFYPRDGAGLSQVITLADKALYRAKRDGKNQVRVHGDGAAATAKAAAAPL
ncbi:sensor domain-containing diguanylate cyclase [Thalassobaculum litoreum]|uniref:Diguanylate cyclase (GGDEF) domain-containing protein n=1 Tax=Thalassobaculum litoreum DSM 18839 TaxID=1123362 RepID=A0A8G2BDX2_9PROT|nr:sensor domain-containing diguanylate cyclase [Thalassobaculum litoreum]SDF05466.1 diguanylate cyclase (GGDEF) domain-containing protein [Thalassobaculum litoreum DSM 18839]